MNSVALLLSCLSYCLLLWSDGAEARSVELRALGQYARSGMMSSLRHQLSQLATPLPAGVYCAFCLVNSVASRRALVEGIVPRSQLQATVLSRGLPQTVADRLAALAFARSVTFHTFTFTVNYRVGYYETFVGAGRRVDAVNVEFGVLHSRVTGQISPRTTPVHQRRCKRRWWIKRCKSWTNYEPRGLTADELRQIEHTLRHFAFAQLRGDFAVKRNRRAAENAVDEAADDLAVSKPATAAQEKLIAVQEADNATLTELVRRGFDELAMSASTQTLRRIPVARTAAFVAVFARSLRLPTSLRDPLRDAVLTAANDSDGRWRQLSVLCSSDADPSAIQFVRVAVRRRGGTFDLASASVRLGVRLARSDRLELLVLDRDDVDKVGDIRVRVLPARVSEGDLRQAERLLLNAAGKVVDGRFSKNVQPAGG